MITPEYTDDTFISFGAHIGKPLKEVPADWLLWIYRTSEDGERLSDKKLVKYIKDNIHALGMRAASERQKRFYERH